MREQLVVPRAYVSKVLYMAHTHLLGAHLGMDKTRERVLARFYWPGVKRDVERHCQGCPECQRGTRGLSQGHSQEPPRPHADYRDPL